MSNSSDVNPVVLEEDVDSGLPSSSLISNPTTDSLSLFLVQVILILAIVRILAKVLAKVRQPPVIGEILAGVVLGPSVLGYLPGFSSAIFPASSLLVLGVVSQVGLILFMFFLGIELDEALFAKYWRSACPIAVVSVVVPFGLGCGLAPLLYPLDPTVASHATFTLFIGTALAFTAFPLLARILTSFHMLDTPFGEHVLAIAAIDDIFAWCTLALTLSYAGGSTPANGVYTALLTAAYLLVMILLVRPALLWLSRQRRFRQKVAGELNRDYICVLLLLLCASSLWTEISGIHAFFGAFVLGVVVPKGKQTDGLSVVDLLAPKIELLIVELFLPLYFAFSGLRTTLGSLDTAYIWGLAVLTITVATVSKVIPVTLVTRWATWQRRLTDDEEEAAEEDRRRMEGTPPSLSNGSSTPEALEMASITPTPKSLDDSASSFSYQTYASPVHRDDSEQKADSFEADPAPAPVGGGGGPAPRGYSWRACMSVGLLMNTTGLVTLIALNIGLDRGILGPKVFSLMVLMALVTTFMTSPVFHWLYYVPFVARKEARQKRGRTAEDEEAGASSPAEKEAAHELAEEESEALSITTKVKRKSGGASLRSPYSTNQVLHLVLNPDREVTFATLKPLSPSQGEHTATVPVRDGEEDRRGMAEEGEGVGGRGRSSSDPEDSAAGNSGGGVYSNKAG